MTEIKPLSKKTPNREGTTAFVPNCQVIFLTKATRPFFLKKMNICQVALSVRNQKESLAFYEDVFGFKFAGKTNSFRGYLAAKIQGLEGASSKCAWLVDKKDFFQMEIFEFKSPVPAEPPAGRSLTDVGYRRIMIVSYDFDDVLARLAIRGDELLAKPQTFGGVRVAAFLDPDGVCIEIRDEDPLGQRDYLASRRDIRSVVRAVSLSVQSLAQSLPSFTEALGVPPSSVKLHSDKMEKQWGLRSARSKRAVLDAGNLLLELNEYASPRPKDWPVGYKVNDYGILNIAFGFRDLGKLRAVYDRALEHGFTPNWRIASLLGASSVAYVNDPKGFSVELLQCKSWFDGLIGFEPGGLSIP